MWPDCEIGPMSGARRKWIAERGPIPEGLWVLHKCDTPRWLDRIGAIQSPLPTAHHLITLKAHVEAIADREPLEAWARRELARVAP